MVNFVSRLKEKTISSQVKPFFQLVAPDLEGIGDVEFELDRGRIKVNEYMETSIPGIYAPGDINGTKMLAHAAFRMGKLLLKMPLKEIMLC